MRGIYANPLDYPAQIAYSVYMNTTEEFQEGSYLTSGEAAKVLHVSTKTVSRWRKEGKMEAEQVRMRRTLGGPKGVIHWRYNADDLAELAYRLTQAAGDAA